MAKKERPTYTADQLADRLAQRYRSDATEVLFGVRNDAGFSATRAADAIAVGLWPSTGCAIEGFEIKVSRSDWLRELKDGGKSEAFMAYVDFWWLVAPRDIVTDDELPPTWGLLVPNGEGLRVARPAKRLDPQPMPRGMLAALVKRASTKQARDAELAKARAEGVEQGKRSVRFDQDYKAREYDRLHEQVRQFEQATGINIQRVYDPKPIATAYALVRNGGHLDLARRIGYAADSVTKLAADLRSVADSIKGEPEQAEAAVA